MGEMASVEIPPFDVLFVGQTGVGKSSLINMIRGVLDNAEGAAKVDNDVKPCTTETTSYGASLGGLQCRLWDMPGLGEAVEVDERWSKLKKIMTDGFRRLLAQQRIQQQIAKEQNKLEETLRDRVKSATPILMWCIDAGKRGTLEQYEPFHKAYVDYCERRAIPVIVLTRMPSEDPGWQEKCNDQLRKLGLAEEVIQLKRVRKYRNPSSKEYQEDAEALRNFISGLMRPDIRE